VIVVVGVVGVVVVGVVGGVGGVVAWASAEPAHRPRSTRQRDALLSTGRKSTARRPETGRKRLTPSLIIDSSLIREALSRLA
jgi:hypothetical protein